MLFYIEYTLTNSYQYSELIKDKLYIEIKSLPCPNTTIQGCTNKYTNGVSQWGIPYFKVIRKNIEKKGKLFSLRKLKKTLFSSLHEQKVRKWRVIQFQNMSFLDLQGSDKISAAFRGSTERVAALPNCLMVKNKCFRLFVCMLPLINIYDKNCIKSYSSG